MFKKIVRTKYYKFLCDDYSAFAHRRIFLHYKYKYVIPLRYIAATCEFADYYK